MTLKEYQKKSRKTAKYATIAEHFVYPAMGLAGEAGEVINKVKKIFRDDNGIVTKERKAEISKELGDVLWYTAQVATDFGLKLEDIAEENIERLYSRLKRGKIAGSGDNR